MNWIRVAVAIGDDPDVHTIAYHLNIDAAHAVGLLVLLLTKFPEHAADGNLKDIPDGLIERWAGWSGERGQFAAMLRAIFLNEDGIWEAWDKHNGKALEKMHRDRERLRLSRDHPATVARPSRDTTGDRRGYGRTDGRTTSGGALHRVENYAPGHVNLMPTKFCAECGDGVLAEVAGSKRPVQTHAPGCGNA